MTDTTVTEAKNTQLDDDAAREELRAKIKLGFQELDRGEGIEANEELFQKFRNYLEQKRTSE